MKLTKNFTTKLTKHHNHFTKKILQTPRNQNPKPLSTLKSEQREKTPNRNPHAFPPNAQNSPKNPKLPKIRILPKYSKKTASTIH